MKRYTVIYADPPWNYGSPNRDAPSAQVQQGTKTQYIAKDGKRKTTRPLGYPMMKTESICALPVRDLAAKDCTLFLWATCYLLPDAIDVMRAWGFDNKSVLVWDKMQQRMGTYSKANIELLLIGGRGTAKPNKECDRRLQYGLPDAVVSIDALTATKAQHSRKPDWFRTEYIDRFWPNGDRIELFARRAAEGWDVWGNEAPNSIEWGTNT